MIKKNSTNEELYDSQDFQANQKDGVLNLEGKKIVWVEDDKFLADIITRKFSETRCRLYYFSEGIEALKAISQEMPNIIMLDIILSGIDGFEILNRIKSDPKTAKIPVIMLSNLGQTADIEKGKKLGAARFMVKATVTPNEIMDQIKQVLAENKK